MILKDAVDSRVVSTDGRVGPSPTEGRVTGSYVGRGMRVTVGRGLRFVADRKVKGMGIRDSDIVFLAFDLAADNGFLVRWKLVEFASRKSPSFCRCSSSSFRDRGLRSSARHVARTM